MIFPPPASAIKPSTGINRKTWMYRIRLHSIDIMENAEKKTNYGTIWETSVNCETRFIVHAFPLASEINKPKIKLQSIKTAQNSKEPRYIHSRILLQSFILREAK